MVRPKFFTPSEVSIHSTQKDLWVSFLGKVYDLTSLCETHQGRHSVTFCFCIWYESGIFLLYASWVEEVAIFQITQVWPVPLKTNQISWLALHFIHNYILVWFWELKTFSEAVKVKSNLDYSNNLSCYFLIIILMIYQ